MRPAAAAARGAIGGGVRREQAPDWSDLLRFRLAAGARLVRCGVWSVHTDLAGAVCQPKLANLEVCHSALLVPLALAVLLAGRDEIAVAALCAAPLAVIDGGKALSGCERPATLGAAQAVAWEVGRVGTVAGRVER